MRGICLLLFVCHAMIGGLWAQGGGWTSGFARGYFKLEQRVVFAEQFFDSEGELIDIPRTSFVTTSFYGQLGLLDRLDISAYVPFLNFNAQEAISDLEKVSETGMGNVTLGVKYGIIKGDILALSVGAQFDMALSGDPKEMLRLQTGAEDFQQAIWTDIGISFWPAHVAAGVAFNNRNEGFSDELKWYLSGGLSLFVFSVQAHVSGLSALDNATFSGNPDLLYSTFLNNRSYLAYGGSINWHLLPILGISVGTDFAAGGQNILAAPAIYGAAFLKI